MDLRFILVVPSFIEHEGLGADRPIATSVLARIRESREIRVNLAAMRFLVDVKKSLALRD